MRVRHDADVPPIDAPNPDPAHEPPPAPGAPNGPGPVPDAAVERPSRRAVTFSVAMLTSSVLLAVCAILPAPYAVSSPGPTEDVLGSIGDQRLITVTGATTYPSTGELRMTTVSATGGPGYPSSTLGVIRGWVSPWAVVQPREILFPDPGETQDQINDENSAQMVSSQENAQVAALAELDYEIPATLVVVGTVEGTGADGVVHEGDVLTAIDGTDLPDYQTLVRTMADVTPGAEVTVTVRREGRERELVVPTTRSDAGAAQMGVYIDPDFQMPVDVAIDAGDIGGPSAGTMFALGIMDLLTPQDEAAGQVIAGTGTIDVVGTVGPIGGIRQKLAGAHRDGADWFLAPAANCGEVVGHVPDGLRVVRIATLHEAYEAVVAIGKGEADDLPTCTAS
ncbi:PDZ/DHR/GLGF domain protein [Cellulomonas gilvus ATCC 13127]|uniref:PDZ/DHR/GLGF domain protein n=1 Tax=Cellulomonas gilvus (strain ATCC 13127 / NRRL B-14078) TaxID=593907 RepID=F8A0G0_CELGA|nr:PDZ/DHR/GLGF domain protein [Cellulomonas gilvus ATCC 13127]